MIDVTFDFTTDTPGYWDGFWERNDGLDSGGSDPDISSPTLQKYHKELWSKKLPNGEIMDLKMGYGSNYLTWKDFRFGSDSIIVSFRYKKYRQILNQVKEQIEDYRAFYETFLRKSYTIGGSIIFPKHQSSMNQNRGTNKLIADRWDLTLECIRRYYAGERSPLFDTILIDKEFYALFVNFKGYVDFFFLQDCVNEDYSQVKIWCGDNTFIEKGLPKTVDEYFEYISKEIEFLENRNKRILNYYKGLI